MQHDIYSLGVCLLEIGIGESFVKYDNEDKLSSDQTSIYFPESGNAGPVKNRLVALAEEHLPRKMGAIYTRVVVKCLTCTDQDNEDFGDDTQFCDEDGVQIGVAYIEKILLQLDSISL